MAPVSFSTPNSDLTGSTSTGMTTVVTGGTNDSIVVGIRFVAITSTGAGTFLNIFYNDSGTRKLVGQLAVPPNIEPDSDTECWTGTWNNPNASGFLAASDAFDVVPMTGGCTFVAWAIGGGDI